jgi:NAD(P)H-hydrate epimerase
MALMTPVSAETMKKLDSMAAISGISILSLMENAGEVVAQKAAKLLNDLKKSCVVIFCGKGNNGGDGFAAARKLKESGFSVGVFLLGKQDEVKNEAAISLRSFIEIGGKVGTINSDDDIKRLNKSLNYSLIIDALLGTGFSGSVSGLLKKLIESLNSVNIPILAVDVPSGLNATTGEINPIAVKAKWTVSFALPKKGFYENSGPDHTGLIRIVNIGFPESLLKKAIEYEKKRCLTYR